MKRKDEIFSKIVLDNLQREGKIFQDMPVRVIKELENILIEKKYLIGEIYDRSFSTIQIK